MKIGMSPFVHNFLRAKAAWLADGLIDYSLGEQARAGRFGQLPRAPNTPPAGLSSAFQCDAGLYARTLRRLVEGNGVMRQESRSQSVERNGESGYALPMAELDSRLANLKPIMAGTVSRLPTHRQFLEGAGAKLEAAA